MFLIPINIMKHSKVNKISDHTLITKLNRNGYVIINNSLNYDEDSNKNLINQFKYGNKRIGNAKSATTIRTLPKVYKSLAHKIQRVLKRKFSFCKIFKTTKNKTLLPHIDYYPIEKYDDNNITCTSLTSFQNNTNLIIWKRSHKLNKIKSKEKKLINPTKINLPEGDTIIWRSDVVHSTGFYDKTNYRVFMCFKHNNYSNIIRDDGGHKSFFLKNKKFIKGYNY
jgi:hypothetical protein